MSRDFLDSTGAHLSTGFLFLKQSLSLLPGADLKDWETMLSMSEGR